MKVKKTDPLTVLNIHPTRTFLTLIINEGQRKDQEKRKQHGKT